MSICIKAKQWLTEETEKNKWNADQTCEVCAEKKVAKESAETQTQESRNQGLKKKKKKQQNYFFVQVALDSGSNETS